MLELSPVVYSNVMSVQSRPTLGRFMYFRTMNPMYYRPSLLLAWCTTEMPLYDPEKHFIQQHCECFIDILARVIKYKVYVLHIWGQVE